MIENMISLPQEKIERLERIFTILGLNESEKKVMFEIYKLAKPQSMLSRHAKIPKTSLPYLLNNLHKRGLVRKTKSFTAKRVSWKSDLERALRELRRLDC